MSIGQGNGADLVKDWTNRDWMVVAGGLVAFIFSLFDYVGVSLGSFGSYTTGAWHSYAILGLLLIFAAAVLWPLLIFGVVKLPTLPAKWEIISAAASGLGTLLIILRAVTYPSPIGIRFGGIVLIIAGFVVTAGAVWALSAGSALTRALASGPTSPRGMGGRAATPGGFAPPSPPPWSPEQASPPQAPPTYPAGPPTEPPRPE